MINMNYTATIEVEKSPQDVFDCLKEVPKWWSRDFSGNSKKINDEFVISHPGRHYSKQKLTEVIPGKRIVWFVNDSELSWLENDKHEWTNTKMIFEIAPNGGKTVLHFTHEGLVPEKECYAMCRKGWDMVIKDRLFNFISVGEAI